jgi:TfoX/Sxy family transcriptional regulator of competence genes
MKWKKPPPDLVDFFASMMPGPPAVPRKMFGYPAGFINGNLFMSLFQDDMILRLPESQRQEMLKKEGAKSFEPMPGRPMREYVAVPPDLLADSRELGSWVLRSLEYASSLKPKSSAKKSKAASAKPEKSASAREKK